MIYAMFVDPDGAMIAVVWFLALVAIGIAGIAVWMGAAR